MTLAEYRHLKPGTIVWTDCDGLFKFRFPGLAFVRETPHGQKWGVRINLFGHGFAHWTPDTKKMFMSTVFVEKD